MKTILELAKEHQVKTYFGKHNLFKNGKSTNYRDKKVLCILCQRVMTAPKIEEPPFYCYKCDEEAEAIVRDNCVIRTGNLG